MKYTLMHKDIEVVDIVIDESIGGIVEINDVYARNHVPLGVQLNLTDEIDRGKLNSWWISRSIPASRKGLDNLLDITGETNIMPIVLKSFGLSLSDHYWVKPKSASLQWKDINFFDNDFSDDIGDILFGSTNTINIDFSSPDNTSDGKLKKRWKIMEGTRVLIKGASESFKQEPFNEVIASSYMKMLNVNCVPYSLYWLENVPYSLCPNFVTKETEFIPASRMLGLRKKRGSQDYYHHFIDCCKDVGIDAVPFLDKMLTIDYILANEDRHYNNFGLIRNPDTLEFMGFAPIFDTGASLLYQTADPRMPVIKSRPFSEDFERQLKYVTSLDWLNPDSAKNISSIMTPVWNDYKRHSMPLPERTNLILPFVQNRIYHVCKMKDILRKKSAVKVERAPLSPPVYRNEFEAAKKQQDTKDNEDISALKKDISDKR